MIECCIDGCENPGTVHANHPGASVYCSKHGICPHCEQSVEFFVHCQDLGIWLCPCVAARRKEQLPPRSQYNPIPVEVSKKTKKVRDAWQRSA